MFRFGYNTNGLPFHRLGEALDLIASLGYEAVALTPDVGALDPLHLSVGEVQETRLRLDDLGLEVAVETGARFVLDPRRKHRPTLLEDSESDRERRVDYYRRSIDLALDLGASVVSLWSGAGPEGVVGTLDASPNHALGDRLASGLVPVLDHAMGTGIRVAFEPEPGMFVERPAGFLTLKRLLGARGDELGLTLDVGHCVVTGDLPVSSVVEDLRETLVHVHLDGCSAGVHEHRPFGEGDLDLTDVLGSLLRADYAGMAAVELSRDGHRGPEAAAEALAALRRALTGI
ncbi:MAG: sugar phosphate isomerase/epimerase family protein [Planctomycetota bacterium]